MKRIALLSMMVVFLGSLAVTPLRAQDSGLGDYARNVRKQKGHQAPAVKKFDNDNLPATDRLSVVGQEPVADPNATRAANNDATASNTATGTVAATPTDPATAAQAKSAAEEEATKKKQLFEEWKKKIQAQQGQVVDQALDGEGQTLHQRVAQDQPAVAAEPQEGAKVLDHVSGGSRQ